MAMDPHTRKLTLSSCWKEIRKGTDPRALEHRCKALPKLAWRKETKPILLGKLLFSLPQTFPFLIISVSSVQNLTSQDKSGDRHYSM